MTHQDVAAQRPLPAGIPQVLRVTATCFFTEACLVNVYQEMIKPTLGSFRKSLFSESVVV